MFEFVCLGVRMCVWYYDYTMEMYIINVDAKCDEFSSDFDQYSLYERVQHAAVV